MENRVFVSRFQCNCAFVRDFLVQVYVVDAIERVYLVIAALYT
jgi:hypothetical protein